MEHYHQKMPKPTSSVIISFITGVVQDNLDQNTVLQEEGKRA